MKNNLFFTFLSLIIMAHAVSIQSGPATEPDSSIKIFHDTQPESKTDDHDKIYRDRIAKRKKTKSDNRINDKNRIFSDNQPESKTDDHDRTYRDKIFTGKNDRNKIFHDNQSKSKTDEKNNNHDHNNAHNENKDWNLILQELKQLEPGTNNKSTSEKSREFEQILHDIDNLDPNLQKKSKLSNERDFKKNRMIQDKKDKTDAKETRKAERKRKDKARAKERKDRLNKVANEQNSVSERSKKWDDYVPARFMTEKAKRFSPNKNDPITQINDSFTF